MHIEEAKKIPIVVILANYGYRPLRSYKGGEELLFFSPLRKEKEPSFFVNIKKNLWNDFGQRGGSILDFLMLYHKTDLKGALKILQEFNLSNFKAEISIKKEKHYNLTDEKKETLKIAEKLSFGEKAKSLVKYIVKERQISSDIAQKYLSEIHFTNETTGKKYFAVGFENSVGGYELRNPFFKGSIGGKAISFVQGAGLTRELIIFEGFINFLSRLTNDNLIAPERDSLILNSAVYGQDALDFIQENNYKTVFGFLDNDEKGSELNHFFQENLNHKYKDCRFLYEGFNDLNEYITHLKS
jgi:hypothetical protein